MKLDHLSLAFPAHAERVLELSVEDQGPAYTVRAEIPGARKRDIQIALQGNEVLVRAELGHGPTSRSLALPARVDARRAEAELSEGVLVLRLPKRRARDTSGNKVVLELQPQKLHLVGAGAYPALSQP